MGISILFAAQTMTYLGVIWKTQQQYYQDEKFHKLRVAEDRIKKWGKCNQKHFKNEDRMKQAYV